MAAEYSYPLVQTVAANGANVLFLNGDRCCKKGIIHHNNSSGVFRIKGVGGCRSIYKVHFNANGAVSAGGTAGPISLALKQNGETIQSAIATVTPTVAEAFFNVGFEKFIELPCGCCDTISIENISETDVDVINANLIIDRVA